MKTTLITLTFLLTCISLQAQENLSDTLQNKKKQNKLIIYTGISGVKLYLNNYISDGDTKYDLGNPSFALTWDTKNKNQVSVEVTKLMWKKWITKPEITYDFLRDTSYYYKVRVKYRDFLASMRFQYGYQIMRNKSKRFNPFLAPGLIISISRLSIYPQSTYHYENISFIQSTDLYFNAGLRINLSKNIFSEICIPISLIKFTYSHFNQKNPLLPKRLQVYEDYNFDFNLKTYRLLKIGFGFKLF